MKKKLYNRWPLLLLCALLLWTLPFAKAQNQIKKEKFIIKTNEPSKLRIVENNFETELSKFKKAGHGFLLAKKNPYKVFVEAVGSEKVTFQLIRLRGSVETKSISITGGDSISLNSCMTDYRMETNSWIDYFTTVINFIMKPPKQEVISTGRQTLFRASPSLIQYTTIENTKFPTPNEVKIEWENLSKEKNLEIVLKNRRTGETTVHNQTTNFFPTASFPKNKLKAGNEYVLSVEVKGTGLPYEFNFAILSTQERQVLKEFSDMNLLGTGRY